MWCHILNVNAEKIFVALVLSSFALTSVVVLFGPRRLLTREEAIEISRNSELVQNQLKRSDRHTLEAHYKNMTRVSDHGMWRITWYIHMIGAPSISDIIVVHEIDEVTGEILVEGTADLR